MSLNNLTFDPFLLAQLYKTELIPAEHSNASEEQSSAISFFGKNDQHITILIYNEQLAWLSDDSFQFLTKILEACHLSMADVALVNIATLPQATLSNIEAELAAQKVIMLGSQFEEWSAMELEKNKIASSSGIAYLWSDNLEVMQSDSELKRAFWKGLRTLFNLK